MRQFIFYLIILHSNVNALNIDYQNDIGDRYSYYNLRETFLNPHKEIFKVSKYENRLDANLSLKLSLNEKMDLKLKIRPSYYHNEFNETKEAIFDDVYLVINPMLSTFISLGKININESVSYSYYPTNFLNEEKKIDYSKKEEERKKDIEGNYVLRIERLFPKFSLSFVCNPKIKKIQNKPSRIETRISLTIPNIDVSFNHFYSSYSAWGLNVSGVASDKLELHLEIAVKKRSNRKYFRVNEEISEEVFTYEPYYKFDNKGIFLKSVFGGQYTFGNNLNIIFEYFYNQDGYNKKDWNNFIDVVKDNYEKYLSPPIGFLQDIFKDNLDVFNSLMTYRFLRKNYLFLRLWDPEFVNIFDFTCGTNINIDDKSGVLISELGYNIMKRTAIYAGNNIFWGNKKSEFGLTPYKNYLYAELRYSF